MCIPVSVWEFYRRDFAMVTLNSPFPLNNLLRLFPNLNSLLLRNFVGIITLKNLRDRLAQGSLFLKVVWARKTPKSVLSDYYHLIVLHFSSKLSWKLKPNILVRNLFQNKGKYWWIVLANKPVQAILGRNIWANFATTTGQIHIHKHKVSNNHSKIFWQPISVLISWSWAWIFVPNLNSCDMVIRWSEYLTFLEEIR